MLRNVTVLLLVILGLLSFRFWCSNDNVLQVLKLKNAIALQQKENLELRKRNDLIVEKLNTLKHSPNAIEEHARYELGMVRRGEKFYQIVEPIE